MDKGKFVELQFNATKEIFEKCCGAGKWVNEMLSSSFDSEADLIKKSEKIWYSLDKEDWLEAFSHHPKIGDINSLKEKFSSSKNIAEKEQSGVEHATEETLSELSKLNIEYEKKFGYIFIVCATGKSAEELLALIKARIENDADTEIRIAMEEQNKITKLRLKNLL